MKSMLELKFSTYTDPLAETNKIQKQKQMQNARKDFGIMKKDCWQASIKVMVARDLCLNQNPIKV